MTTFRAETLPTDRPTYNPNILKLTAQKNVFLTRYLKCKNDSYIKKYPAFWNFINRELNIILHQLLEYSNYK